MLLFKVHALSYGNSGTSIETVEMLLKMYNEDIIISAGNFHGQPLALALDYLAISMSELGSISERRIDQLISGKRGLPPFLSQEAGLNSGFMITQYFAASIASRNKQLATPASVDSIES